MACWPRMLGRYSRKTICCNSAPTSFRASCTKLFNECREFVKEASGHHQDDIEKVFRDLRAFFVCETNIYLKDKVVSFHSGHVSDYWIRWILCQLSKVPCNPVVFIEEESVYGCEPGLDDGPRVSGSQVLRRWIRIPRGKSALRPHGQVALAKLAGFAVSLQLGTVSKSKRGLVVRSIDLAAVDERCDPVDLLTWLPTHPLWAKGIRPEWKATSGRFHWWQL